MPPLTGRGMGRGQGQRRFYAFDPSDQLATLLQYRGRHVPVAECAVRLWLSGFPVDLRDIRRHLPRALKTVHRFRKLLRSSSFSFEFAEYLHRTPRAREAWFGDRDWSSTRYNDAIALGEAMVTDDPSARPRVSAAAERFTKLTDDERSLMVALGGSPEALMGSSFSVFRRLFEELSRATDDDLQAARAIQQRLLVLVDINRRIAALMPNVLSSLISKFSEHDDLQSSWGFFAAFGMLTLTRAEDLDVLANLQQRIEELGSVLARLGAGPESSIEEISERLNR